MPVPKPKPHDPVTVISASAKKEAEKADWRATKDAFITLLILLVLIHAIGHLVIAREGMLGYFRHIVDLGSLFVDTPALAVPAIAAFACLYWGIHFWRHRHDQVAIKLPPFSQVPDLRFEDGLYLGSGYTSDGKQPGDILEPGETLLDEQHVILTEKGLFGNIHIKGAIGSGKTTTCIEPVMDQGMMKYPKPMPPSHFELGSDGRFRSLKIPRGADIDPFDLQYWNPYEGLTAPEARERFAELLDLHERRKWAMLIFDAKGDLTKKGLQMAKATGREDDCIVLCPGSEWTLNPLAVDASPLVMAETFMDGIEAVTGRLMHEHFRQVGSEWLANALSVLKAVNPAEVNFKTVLRMARDESIRSRYVNEAIARGREFRDDEARARRLGRTYGGPRIDPAATQFFTDFDDPDNDPAAKKAVVSGIKAQARLFVEESLAPFLCPDMPPTFGGFAEMIDRGRIVFFRMPIADYGTVGRIIGILLLADAQRAALSRLDPNNPINKERILLIGLDEVQNFLNKETKNFISMSRQARVLNMFAHQSQGQLIQEGDRGFETSFNDNLRTKISYSAPHAEAGTRESRIFGTRKIMKERYSEGTSFQGVAREEGGAHIKPKGGESKSATVSMAEEHESWFSAEDFVQNLRTGQAVVSVFDGERTLPPRKIVAPAFYASARGRHVESISVEIVLRAPHPAMFLTGEKGDMDYLGTALSNTGYVLAETLLDREGEAAALKFVSEAGTAILPLSVVDSNPDAYDMIGQRLSTNHCVVIPIDGLLTAAILTGECGVRFERVLPLPEGLNHPIGEDGATLRSRLGLPEVSSFPALFSEVAGKPLGYNREGGWEYHDMTNPIRRRQVIETSRLMLGTYVHIGDALMAIPEADVENLFDAMREQLEMRLQSLDEAPEPPPKRAAAETPAEPDSTPQQEKVTRTGKPSSKPVRKKAAKKTAPAPARPRKARSPGVPPLFDLESLNDLLAPSPFDDTTDDPRTEPLEDAGDPPEPGDLRGDDTGPDDVFPGEESYPDDQDDFYPPVDGTDEFFDDLGPDLEDDASDEDPSDHR
jgi:hypothetical protein